MMTIYNKSLLHITDLLFTEVKIISRGQNYFFVKKLLTESHTFVLVDYQLTKSVTDQNQSAASLGFFFLHNTLEI